MHRQADSQREAIEDRRDRERSLTVPRGLLTLPVFLPDGTLGVVRSLDSGDLESVGIEAVQTNVFHLMQRPGTSVIKAIGGLHAFMGWRGPIVTDSGGFQVYSLIRQNPRYGQLTPRGLVFRPEDGSRRVVLTPERSVQLQLGFGADIVICLDDCTSADESRAAQAEAVRRTVAWAKKSKEAFERTLAARSRPTGQRPLLFAVVQGGNERDLRRECAEELLAIGFDGYGLGGWPLDKDGRLLEDIIGYTRSLIPEDFPMHALGIGHPDSLVACASLGYDLFDSTMPTRDARHGRLYVFCEDPSRTMLRGRWFSYLYIQDEQHIREKRPVSEHCDCLCCRRYSLAYVHHLFKVRDGLYHRLATLHNLRFMVRLVDRLRTLASTHGTG